MKSRQLLTIRGTVLVSWSTVPHAALSPMKQCPPCSTVPHEAVRPSQSTAPTTVSLSATSYKYYPTLPAEKASFLEKAHLLTTFDTKKRPTCVFSPFSRNVRHQRATAGESSFTAVKCDVCSQTDSLLTPTGWLLKFRLTGSSWTLEIEIEKLKNIVFMELWKVK